MMMAVFEEMEIERDPSFNPDNVASGLRNQGNLIEELVSAIETKDLDSVTLMRRITEIESNLKKLKKAV